MHDSWSLTERSAFELLDFICIHLGCVMSAQGSDQNFSRPRLLHSLFKGKVCHLYATCVVKWICKNNCFQTGFPSTFAVGRMNSSHPKLIGWVRVAVWLAETQITYSWLILNLQIMHTKNTHFTDELLLYLCISPMTHDSLCLRHSSVFVPQRCSGVRMENTNGSKGHSQFLLSFVTAPPISKFWLQALGTKT